MRQVTRLRHKKQDETATQKEEQNQDVNVNKAAERNHANKQNLEMRKNEKRKVKNHKQEISQKFGKKPHQEDDRQRQALKVCTNNLK